MSPSNDDSEDDEDESLRQHIFGTPTVDQISLFLRSIANSIDTFQRYVLWTRWTNKQTSKNKQTKKGPIFSEKYWYYFHCPKNVLDSILSFVFWIFPPSDTAVQLESGDSKQNTILKSLFQDSFRHIFWAMRKMHHTLWKKRPLWTVAWLWLWSKNLGYRKLGRY